MQKYVYCNIKIEENGTRAGKKVFSSQTGFNVERRISDV